jgi:hypothetical protein
MARALDDMDAGMLRDILCEKRGCGAEESGRDE